MQSWIQTIVTTSSCFIFSVSRESSKVIINKVFQYWHFHYASDMKFSGTVKEETFLCICVKCIRGSYILDIPIYKKCRICKINMLISGKMKFELFTIPNEAWDVLVFKYSWSRRHFPKLSLVLLISGEYFKVFSFLDM